MIKRVKSYGNTNLLPHKHVFHLSRFPLKAKAGIPQNDIIISDFAQNKKSLPHKQAFNSLELHINCFYCLHYCICNQSGGQFMQKIMTYHRSCSHRSVWWIPDTAHSLSPFVRTLPQPIPAFSDNSLFESSSCKNIAFIVINFYASVSVEGTEY